MLLIKQCLTSHIQRTKNIASVRNEKTTKLGKFIESHKLVSLFSCKRKAGDCFLHQ